MATICVDTLYIVDDFKDGFTLNRGKLNDKILLYVFLVFVGCVDGVQCICARMVAIHTETLLTFHFDPSSIS